MVVISEIVDEIPCSSKESLAAGLRCAIAQVKSFFVDENVREALREKVTNLSIFVYEKSDEKAAAFRTKGNEFFKDSKFEDAILQYDKVC